MYRPDFRDVDCLKRVVCYTAGFDKSDAIDEVSDQLLKSGDAV